MMAILMLILLAVCVMGLAPKKQANQTRSELRTHAYSAKLDLAHSLTELVDRELQNGIDKKKSDQLLHMTDKIMHLLDGLDVSLMSHNQFARWQQIYDDRDTEELLIVEMAKRSELRIFAQETENERLLEYVRSMLEIAKKKFYLSKGSYDQVMGAYTILLALEGTIQKIDEDHLGFYLIKEFHDAINERERQLKTIELFLNRTRSELREQVLISQSA